MLLPLHVLRRLSYPLKLSFQICTQSPPFSAAAAAAAAADSLQSCTHQSSLLQTHAHILRNDLLLSSFHWNSLIRSYLRLSRPNTALLLFVLMSRSGAPPDAYTLPILFKAISLTFALEAGRQFHSIAVKHGLDRQEHCESGLISFYSKAGEFEHALKVFDHNPERKLGSWNAIINGLAQAGHSKEAVNLFIELRRSGLAPDGFTMVSVASASGVLGDIGLAEQVHKCVLQARSMERLDVMRSNSLIDMYSKCGRTDLALKVFDRIPHRDVSSWTAMITGLATHGHVAHALELFDRMLRHGVKPNHVTFVGVLVACTHGGLVEEGMAYFDTMKDRYGIEPTVAHYGCVVDMLGRVGRLEEAKVVVERMPMAANAVIWGTMLGACDKYGKVEIGEWVATKLLEVEPWNDGVYVVLSNIYAGAGMWAEVQKMRRLMWDRRVAKAPGFSATAISN